MDSPPSNRAVAHDALPDELLEFIDEATLLESESQGVQPPEQAKAAAVAAAPAKPVLVERINVAPPPPIPLPVAPPEDDPPLRPPAVAVTVPATPRPAASTASPLPAQNTAPAKAPAAITAPPLVVISTERSSQAPVSTHVLTLADLRSPKIERSWQEAVAVVLELLDGRPNDAGCPEAEAATIATSGIVRATAAATSLGHPVAAAARLLGDLLPPTRVPPELRGLIDRDTNAHPEHASLKDFVRAISYFGRPNRQADAAAFCERALEFHRVVQADREIDRLRTRANEDSDRERTGLAAWLPRVTHRSSQSAVAAGLWALILLNATALVWFAVTPAPARPPLAPLEQPAPAPPPPLATNLDTFVGPPLPSDQPSRRVEEPAPRVTPPRLIVQPIPVAANMPAAPTVAIRPAAPTGSTSRASEFNVFVREVPPDRPVATRGTVDADAIYSDQDADVTPAALMHPQVPIAEAGSTTEHQVSEFELIINRAGRVERVRLVNPINQLQDKMMLAAAKAWLFRPAVRDGQSVRYRLQLRVQR